MQILPGFYLFLTRTELVGRTTFIHFFFTYCKEKIDADLSGHLNDDKTHAHEQQSVKKVLQFLNKVSTDILALCQSKGTEPEKTVISKTEINTYQ